LLDPPSQELVDRLLTNQICTLQDLKRCRRRVQQLTRDLPAFDSVWIDALLQDQKLTPYQAKLLDSRHPDRLVVGPCLLLDRLGGGRRGETFLARHKPTRQTCALKLVQPQLRFSGEEQSELAELIARMKKVRHPTIVGPQVCDRLGEQLVIVSHHVAGPHLAELIVRRGRFPAGIVWELGRQLLHGLAELHQAGLTHGDIRTHNVRLNESGLAVLVDSGIRPILEKDLTIHTAAAPERFDGTAPELIGTGREHTPASDFYALGCLLWQLLAGRPPFPGGDPLAKLAAHQTQTVSDIREWVPDAPEKLALALLRLTDPDPTKRPQSAEAAMEVWGKPTRLARNKVARFVAGFRTPARGNGKQPLGNAAGRFAPMFVLVFILSGLITLLANQGARTALLNVVHQYAPELEQTAENQTGHDKTEKPSAETTPKPTEEGRRQSRYRPLPQPKNGVLELNASGPYRAGKITAVGPLVIRGMADRPAKIVVLDAPLTISAESVRLENVDVTIRSAKPPASLLLAQTDRFDIVRCQFQTHSFEESLAAGNSAAARLSHSPIAIGWRNLGESPGGRVRLEESQFLGLGTALHLASAPQKLDAENCLRLGAGPLFVLAKSPRPGRPLVVKLSGVTTRGSGPLLNWRLPDQPKNLGQVQIEATSCVFDLASPQVALFEFIGGPRREDWHKWISLVGADALMSEQSPPAAWLNRRSGKYETLDDRDLKLEGLFAVPYAFAGQYSANPADAELAEIRASISRRSVEMPGFHTNR